MTNITLQ